jgi:nicotinamide mononucleotide transporter
MTSIFQVLMKNFIKNELSGWRKGELAWMAFSLAAVIGLSIHWKDSALGIVAAATGMMYTLLAGKGKISCFAFGIVNSPLYAYAAWQQRYYADTLLYLYYFIMMFPGIIAWRRHKSPSVGEGVEKKRLASRERAVLAAAILCATLLLSIVLSAVGGNRPICDAVTNTLSVAAMILTVRRAVEQWMMWIAVDAIEIFMWWKVWAECGNSISLLLMWALFLANGIYLRRRWIVDMRRNGAL